MKSHRVKNGIDSKRFFSKYLCFIERHQPMPESASHTDKKMIGLELDFSPMLLSVGLMENY